MSEKPSKDSAKILHTTEISKKLEELRNLVLNDKQLTSREDDIFLLNFLRARKYNTGCAFQLIKNFYATRKKYPEVFKDLRPSSIEKCMDAKIGDLIVMEDFVLGIGKVGCWDPEQVHLVDIVRNIILQLDCMLKDDLLKENKIVGLFDVEGLSWKHFLQASPRMLYIVVSSLYGSYPVRYSQFHIINENRLTHALLLMLLPLLPRKLKSRIHLHGSSIESLHKFVPPKYLPADFGGELPLFDPTERHEKLRANEDYFIENEKYWTAEKQEDMPIFK